MQIVTKVSNANIKTFFGNSQKQPLEVFYEKRSCYKFHKIHRKAPVPTTLLKKRH